MSDPSDDELPDVAASLFLPESPAKSYKVSYQINLNEEIKLRRLNFEKEQERVKVLEEEKQKEIDDKIASEQYQKDILNSLSKIEAIPDEAPGREFIQTGFSFRQFNADNLVKPHIIRRVNPKDLLLFYQYIRNTLQDTTASESGRDDFHDVLRYVLFLASVHQDQFIVESCLELLLEYNNQWEINHTVLLAIFQNWGADITQVLPAYPSAPDRIKRSNPKTVSFHNVNAVLQVLFAQLKLRKQIDRCNVTTDFGLWNVDELVFGLLVLLSLDTKYVGCLPHIQECVCELLTRVNEVTAGNWASDYSQLLLCMETDNYNLTSLVSRVLTGSSACENLRLNISYAAIQRILGVSSAKIIHVFNRDEFERSIRSTSFLAELKSIDIFCLLIFVDTIIRHPQLKSEETLRIFSKWLTRLHSKVSQNPHVIALISNLNCVWDDETNAAE